MSNVWLKAYLDAWSVHGDGKRKTADAMVEAASTDIRYADINLPEPWLGHDGLRAACAGASALFPGLVVNIETVVTDGSNWAVRWTMQAKHAPTGKLFGCKGASFGTLGPDGKVNAHTDYWNPGHAEAQIGVRLIPGG
jgi:hypothetical protein